MRTSRAGRLLKDKIKNLTELKKIREKFKKLQKKVVFTNGCFDLLHYGHVKYLEQAKAKGDVLIVAVNSDSSVRRIKGKHRPITDEKDRLGVIAGLESVDYVVKFKQDTPLNIIRALNPDILVIADKERPVAIAGIMGGKSYLGSFACYRECNNNVLAKCWYVSGTYKLLRNSFNHMLSWGHDDGSLLRSDRQQNTLYYNTASWVAMQTAQNVYFLRGDHLDLAVLDEGSVMSELVLERVRDRLSGRSGKVMILSNAPNPGEPGFTFIHNLYREWSGLPPAQARVLAWPTWDNYLAYPGGEQDPKILQEKANRSPDNFRRMIAADMSIRDGLVYPSFNRARHVIPGPYTPKGRVFIFGDYGMNTASIHWADLIDNEHLVIFKEFYKPDVLSPKVAEHYMAGTIAIGMTPRAIRDVYIDTANADLKGQVKAKGFNVERYGKVDKSNKVQLIEREERWFDQTASDGLPKLRITSDCPHLIWECENLIVGKDSTLPKDGQPNHATDGVQYGLCGIESGARRGSGLTSSVQVVNVEGAR